MCSSLPQGLVWSVGSTRGRTRERRLYRPAQTLRRQALYPIPWGAAARLPLAAEVEAVHGGRLVGPGDRLARALARLRGAPRPSCPHACCAQHPCARRSVVCGTAHTWLSPGASSSDTRASASATSARVQDARGQGTGLLGARICAARRAAAGDCARHSAVPWAPHWRCTPKVGAGSGDRPQVGRALPAARRPPWPSSSSPAAAPPPPPPRRPPAPTTCRKRGPGEVRLGYG